MKLPLISGLRRAAMRACNMGIIGGALFLQQGTGSAAEQPIQSPVPVRPVDGGYTPYLSLDQAINQALLQNRQLQIERSRQEVAEFTLRAARGIFDPRFETRVSSESASDTGGFDPANFSADAVYQADSEVINSALVGVLPTGLIYSIGGNFAHSQGERNFLNFDSYKVGTGIYLEQPLLRNMWIDQPRWTIQINKKNLKITELGVQFIAMSVINLVQQGYFDLIYANENLKVHQDLVETRQTFVRGIGRQIELGQLTALEQSIAQSQAAALQTDVVGASNLVAQASNNLRTLMGVPGTNWTTTSYVPTDIMLLLPENLDLQSSWHSGLKYRPDFLQLAINVESAELTRKYRQNQLFPTLNLIGSYSLRGADALQAFAPDQPKAELSLAFDQIKEQAAPNSMIGVLFSVPLTSTAERNNYKASKELKKQAELLLKQKEEFVMREISDAVDLARFSFDRFNAARESVRFAEQAVKAEEQRLLGGSGSIFLVLQAQTDFARARSAELIAKRDYNKALSQLYYAEGSLLQRKNIHLSFQ